MFIVPEEEVNAYFGKEAFISYDALNEIDWWKYHQLSVEEFDMFKAFLPKRDSWSNDIVLFGDESSNCIEVLMEQDKIIEVSARVDLRYDYKQFVKLICKFAQNNNCVILNNDLKIISPNTQLLEQDIASFPAYRLFLEKLM